jgi:acyl CoA:acetate/3-ketoacid CoA transferase alpha subunit
MVITDDEGDFTSITTPKENEKDKWAGDFRLVDIENIIKNKNLLSKFILNKSITVDSIVEQK